MPTTPIIDAHVHLYDGSRVPYTWMKEEWPTLNSPHLMADFDQATAGMSVKNVLFCEVHPDAGHHIDEVRFVQSLAIQDTRIAAITAWAPIEKGDGAARDLEALAAFPLVRGVRRGFAGGASGTYLEPSFLEGVRMLGRLGLHYELGLPHWMMGYGLELARRVPEVSIVLNHIGNPDIAHNLWEPWRAQITEMGKLDNVSVKISGAMAGAAKNWRISEIVPFVQHALDCFGFDRCMFGSDWPAAERFCRYGDWVKIVDEAIASASLEETQKLYFDTASRIFRLADHHDKLARGDI